jgi:hypothetical protein
VDGLLQHRQLVEQFASRLAYDPQAHYLFERESQLAFDPSTGLFYDNHQGYYYRWQQAAPESDASSQGQLVYHSCWAPTLDGAAHLSAGDASATEHADPLPSLSEDVLAGLRTLALVHQRELTFFPPPAPQPSSPSRVARPLV